jgi:TonB family protein
MSDIWQLCEGQVIENRFRLRQYLGGTDDSAVFFTYLDDSKTKKAAIKFIPAGPTADFQLSLWRRAMQLSHPHLLRIHDIGRCRLENRDRLFVVMEYAEEDLSQILPQRALTPAEARDMLAPVLDALVYLHSNGLVHSRIKPSNILATADQLKLSSDAIFQVGESRKVARKFDAHDAPETTSSALATSADVWSLGVTLVETLTQQAPALPAGSQADPGIPDSLPQPFLDIARHTLRRDPRRRWTIGEIAARLNPMAAAASAAQSLSPLTVPLSSVPALPAAKLQSPAYDPPPPPRPQPPSQRAPVASPPKQTLVLPNYVVPVAAGLLVILAIFALPKILGRRPESSSSASTSTAAPAEQPKPADASAGREIVPASKPPASSPKQSSLKATPEKKTSAPKLSVPIATPTPASVRTAPPPSTSTPTASPSSRGEVLDQILPQASEKALATIHGVVHVSVRVHVDPTGNVANAEFESPGPSKYFADLALQAARKWQFSSPELGGHSVPSEWIIRFRFTPSGPKAIPSQVGL